MDPLVAGWYGTEHLLWEAYLHDVKKNGLPKLLVDCFGVCSRGWRTVATRSVVGIAFGGTSQRLSRHCGIVMIGLLRAGAFVEIWEVGITELLQIS